MLRRLFAAAVLLTSCSVIAQQDKPPVKAEAPQPGEAPATADAPAAPSAASPAAATAKITFSQCHVDGPYIAFTYDDGPHATNTPRLLEMLKQRGIKATFFCVGQCVAEYPEIAKRIVEEGHEIANHSWSHPLLSKMNEASVREQIEKTHQAIKQATGVEPKIFRPPYGGFTLRQRQWANAVFGYKTVLWDVDTLDWQHHNPAKTESIALSQTRSGSIILTHDIHKTTIDAMPTLLDALLAKGFKFVTVSELIAMDKPEPPKAKATPAPKAEGAKATSAKRKHD